MLWLFVAISFSLSCLAVLDPALSGDLSDVPTVLPIVPAAESVSSVPPAIALVSLALVSLVPPAIAPVSSSSLPVLLGLSNVSSSASTAPVAADVNDAPASMPAVLERFNQIIKALKKIARQRKSIPRGGIPSAMKRPDTCRRCIIKGGVYKNKEHIYKAWAGEQYDASHNNIAMGKEFFQTWKNYNKAQDALPSDKKMIQQLDHLIGISRFSAMMAAFDHRIPMADVDAVGFETNKEVEDDETAGQGPSSG
ncbi:hypothetical protein MMC07_009135 [Pseudocyphellaria aurata]|nr:hypothetical protein [Pseudocyphellaria aurata]